MVRTKIEKSRTCSCPCRFSFLCWWIIICWIYIIFICWIESYLKYILSFSTGGQTLTGNSLNCFNIEWLYDNAVNSSFAKHSKTVDSKIKTINIIAIIPHQFFQRNHRPGLKWQFVRILFHQGTIIIYGLSKYGNHFRLRLNRNQRRWLDTWISSPEDIF